MKKGCLISLIAVAVVIIIIIIGIASTSWGHYKELIRLDNRIEAQYIANKSNYDNMWKSFKEITQVTDIQAEQYKDVYMGLIEGRYQDQNLLFKSIQEDNPTFDTALYTKLATTIEAGRREFDNNQKKITDVIREYNDAVQIYFIIAPIAGKTIKDANDYIITSARTSNAFETKQDNVIDLKGE